MSDLQMDCKIESPKVLEPDNEPENDIASDSSTTAVPDMKNIAAEYRDYVDEMQIFITAHVQVTNSNAIELNETFRDMLIALRTKLEDLRSKCIARYEANANELKQSKKKTSLLRGKFSSYASCGQPYFKNRKFYKAPPNQDYLLRKTKFKELFPLDLDYTFGQWTMHDKTTLIFGIKEQLITHLEMCNVESRILLRKARLADLYKLGATFISSFSINWDRLVLQNLKERHNVSEAISMWNEYLHPDIRRGPWTSVEDTRLMHAAKKFNFQNWYEIAKMVPNRSKLQCMVQCHCVLFDRLRIRHSRWTKEEDDVLINAVRKYSLGKYIPWTKVTEQLPYRSKIQVYHRYIYSLDPDINHSRFSPEEDCVLLAAIQQYGTNYGDIPNDILPGRTQSQIRQRYNNVLKHSGKIKFWCIEDDRKLMELVEEHGTSNWAEISRVLSNHTRISCRTRYLVIKQYLDKNPKGTIDNAPRKKRGNYSKINEDNWLDTLIKLKSDPPVGTLKPVVVHVPDLYTKLNTIQRLYYDFFKYSYNFKYDTNPYGNFSMEFIQKNTILYSKFLDFDITLCHAELEHNATFNTFETTAINYIGQSLYKFMHILYIENLSIIPPPSWDLMLLYRNLSTFTYRYYDSEKINNDEPITKDTPYQPIAHPALATFKKRLALLLYYPHLLSECKLSNYVPPSIEQSNSDTAVESANTIVIEDVTNGEGCSSKRLRKIEKDPVIQSRKKIKK